MFACLTTAFYSVARLGELTLLNLAAFDAAVHVKPSDVRSVRDRNGLEETAFFIPRTKAAASGEDIFWARQNGLSDPETAWLTHLAINSPPRDGPLFAYRLGDSYRPLTRTAFLAAVSAALKRAGLSSMHGHGIRIGGTLEYLLRNVPFAVVKSKGRWSSTPELNGAFVRFTMPPIR